MKKPKRAKAITQEPASVAAVTAAGAGSAVSFNPDQLATYEQARELREYLNQNNIGRGIPMGDDEKGVTLVQNVNLPWLPPVALVTGIFKPSWEGGPTGFPRPQATGPNGEKLEYLYFRFANGFVSTVGLILDKFRRYPGQNAYVLSALAQEIGQ